MNISLNLKGQPTREDKIRWNSNVSFLNRNRS